MTILDSLRVRRRCFVSYRHDSSTGEAGHLADLLRERYGAENVFFDAHIKTGDDFARAIKTSLATFDVLLAVIGPDWIDARDSANQLRLWKDDDWVRLEIATALELNLVVAPVLVSKATLPTLEQLPEPLRPLLRGQQGELRSKTFRDDVRRMLDDIELVLDAKVAGGVAWRRRLQRLLRRASAQPRRLALAAVLALCVPLAFVPACNVDLPHPPPLGVAVASLHEFSTPSIYLDSAALSHIRRVVLESPEGDQTETLWPSEPPRALERLELRATLKPTPCDSLELRHDEDGAPLLRLQPFRAKARAEPCGMTLRITSQAGAPAIEQEIGARFVTLTLGAPAREAMPLFANFKISGVAGVLDHPVNLHRGIPHCDWAAESNFIIEAGDFSASSVSFGAAGMLLDLHLQHLTAARAGSQDCGKALSARGIGRLLTEAISRAWH